jgi:hypothetical protein
MVACPAGRDSREGRLGYRYFGSSGMTARDTNPAPGDPRAWVVWHFTHIDNLPRIIAQGGLLASNRVDPTTNVASSEVKDRRTTAVVRPDTSYPPSVVSDHVPFYIAPKSPMLYVVHRGHPEYLGGCEPLIFLGCLVGDIFDSGLIWCISDGNAAATFTRFSRDEATLGKFVDFPLLCQRDWYNTSQDSDRKRRRAAEMLVRGQVPLGLISVVVARNDTMLARARGLLESVGGKRDYVRMPKIYY